MHGMKHNINFCHLYTCTCVCVFVCAYLLSFTDLLCQHISGAQWQVSVPQLLQNSPIRWAAGVSSGYHHEPLQVETTVCVHWGTTTVPRGTRFLVQCTIKCIKASYISVQLNQLLQQAENINISVRDTLHWDSLTNFTKFADMISYMFVSDHSKPVWLW